MYNNSDVRVGGKGDLIASYSTYKTKVLPNNLVDHRNVLTQLMMNTPNTKYVIKWDYVLNESITLPAGCLIEFDGGSIRNDNGGTYTLTGQDTILLFYIDKDKVIKDVELLGNFIFNGSIDTADEEDITGKTGVLKFANKDYDPENFSGLGRVYLRKNIGAPVDPDNNIWCYKPSTDELVYLIYRYQGVYYHIYDEGTGKGLVLHNNIVKETDEYNVANLPEPAQEHNMPYIKNGDRLEVTLPDNTVVDDSQINNTEIFYYVDEEGDESQYAGKNILTQDMINKPNTIYIIQYDYVISPENENTIEVPEGCVLKFEGGTIKNGVFDGYQPYIDTDNLEIFDNVTFICGIRNYILYAEWWKHDEEIDATQALNNIFDTAFHSHGITVQFGHKQWKFDTTIGITTESANSYTGYKLIVAGVQNEVATLLYTGNATAFTFVDSNTTERGSLVTFKNIKIEGADAEYLLYFLRSSLITLDSVSLSAPNGTCVYAANMWDYRIESSFISGRFGLSINGGTSAYISNLFLICTEKAVFLKGVYVHISNIFGDYNRGTFMHLEYCRGTISTLGCESWDVDRILVVSKCLLTIGEMDVFKPLADEAGVLIDGSSSSIHIENMHITDKGNPAPRGYLVKGSWRLNVVIEKLQVTEGSKFKYEPTTSDGAKCSVFVKLFGEGEAFGENYPTLRERQWLMSIYGGALGHGAMNDAYMETPQFQTSRIILGLRDYRTATKIVDGEAVPFDVRDYNDTRVDDVFINSKVTAGYPYFAWSCYGFNGEVKVDNAYNKFVQFITAIEDMQNAPTAYARPGFMLFNTATKKPLWWDGSNWRTADGDIHSIPKVGMFNQIISYTQYISPGYAYFATDKGTAGVGAIVYYTGNSTTPWVYADGTAVS